MAGSGLDARPPAVLLMGPTACGKTDLALALAERFPVDLISADSALVYRGLDIGAAKPDAATLARHPHALVDIREPDQPFSAGEFRTGALAAMAASAGRGRVPLLVGGTGLYFRALVRGLAPLPVADPAVREALAERAQREGWPALHAQLARLDPTSAARIRPGDRQRLQRALEVCQLTGRPLSELQAAAAPPSPYRLLKLVLLPADRQALHERIARRLDAMLAAGFLDEVRRLRADSRRFDPALPALRAVGYRQAWRHLEGGSDADGFRREAIAATRQLAKRQLTWFRAERDGFVLEPVSAGLADAAAVRIALFLAPGDGAVRGAT